jgi:hypothetical protein
MNTFLLNLYIGVKFFTYFLFAVKDPTRRACCGFRTEDRTGRNFGDTLSGQVGGGLLRRHTFHVGLPSAGRFSR